MGSRDELENTRVTVPDDGSGHGPVALAGADAQPTVDIDPDAFEIEDDTWATRASPAPASAMARSGLLEQRPFESVDQSPEEEETAFDLQPGTSIDQYQVVRPIGRGGMGVVYLARDRRLGRKAALKLIAPRALRGTDARARFEREVKLTAQLNHPHIVTVFGSGEYEGCPYVALEYLPGETLRQRLKEERPALRQALRIGMAIAEGVAEAHKHGILHRDLKPANILIPPDGRLRVLDFGLARLLDEEGAARSTPASPTEGTRRDVPAHRETGARGVVGTPRYMAPEQWRQQAGTPATDIWALGLILHELFAGRHPLSDFRTTYEILAFACSPNPIPSLSVTAPAVPSEIVELVDRCMDKDPAGRPMAHEIVAGLSAHLGGPERKLHKSPFRGLLPFTERHAGLFYGRDSEIGAFLEKTREEPILAVVGPSGSGKSSFIRAGVIPRLREQGAWEVLAFRPGSQPFRTLASRLVRGESSTMTTWPSTRSSPRSLSEFKARSGVQPALQSLEADEAELAEDLRRHPERMPLVLAKRAQGNKILIFVDQLEELATLVPADDAGADLRRAFLRALAAAADDPAGPIRVVVTLRDDFLGRLAEGGAADRVFARVTVLQPPSPAALRETLERPVLAAGFRFSDPELTAEMVRAVAGESTALPLLQFAAERLWAQRDRGSKRLTREAYVAIGGVAGALAQHADGVIGAMTPAEEQIARTVFVRLVTEDGTRQVLGRSALISGLGPNVSAVLERLARERLILVRKGRTETELELVHESLLTAWDRLARWLDESREERVFLTEVGQASALWDKRGRRRSEVWEGDALVEANRRARRCDIIPEVSQAFLNAGRRRESARRWRRRALAAGVAAALALVFLGLVAGLVVVSDKEEEAQAQRREAQRQRGAAELASARAALIAGDPLEARARVRLGLELGDSIHARGLLLRLSGNPLVWKREFGGAISDVAVSPDGQRIAVASDAVAVYVVDRTTSVITTALRGTSDHARSLGFGPDGEHLVSGSSSGEIRVWDLATGDSRRIGEQDDDLSSVAFAPDGKTVASSGEGGAVHVWDAREGGRLFDLRGHTGRVTDVVYTPDSRAILSAGHDATVRVWDLATEGERLVFRGHDDAVTHVEVTPDGTKAASVGYDGALRLWDLETGRTLHVTLGRTSSPTRFAFGPKSETLAIAERDGSVGVWTLADWSPHLILVGHDEPAWHVAFGRDGTLVTGSDDETVRVWDVTTKSAQRPHGHEGSVGAVAFAPDGEVVASAGFDKKVHVWGSASGAEVQVLSGHEAAVWGLAFSPDSTKIASVGEDRTVRLWDWRLGGEQVLRGHKGALWGGVAFSPDGATVASGAQDRVVRLWDVASGKQRLVLRGHTETVLGLAFSPDGKRLAAGSHDDNILIWDVETGKRQLTLHGHRGSVREVKFLPSGDALASGAEDGQVRMWDLRTRIPTLEEQPGRIYSIDVDPAGEHVAAADSSGRVRIWNMADDSLVWLEGHRSEVDSVRFGPDGRRLVTGSDDGTVRLWDAATGNPIWRGPFLRATSLEFYTHRGWIALDPGSEDTGGGEHWREAIADSARQADEIDGGPLCIATTSDTLEIWSPDEDRRLAEIEIGGVSNVIAVPHGCVTLSGPGGRGRGTRVAKLHSSEGRTRTLRRHADAIGWDSETRQLLIADDEEVHLLDVDGSAVATRRVSPAPSCVARVGTNLATGFQDGSIELTPLTRDEARPVYAFEATPASPVLSLISGPDGTLAAGFANGEVGLWSLDNGQLIERGRVHGPVRHLLLKRGHLYAATELGDYVDWDLGVFYEDYCPLLHHVWDTVDVIWDNGVPVVGDIPSDHRCSLASEPTP